MNVKKLISIVAVAGIVIATILGTFVYFKAFTANTQFAQDEVFVYVPTDASYEEVKEMLSPLLKDIDKFDFVATSRNYATNIKSGKFLLKKNFHHICFCYVSTKNESDDNNSILEKGI